jgi:hypothetical protein
MSTRLIRSLHWRWQSIDEERQDVGAKRVAHDEHMVLVPRVHVMRDDAGEVGRSRVSGPGRPGVAKVAPSDGRHAGGAQPAATFLSNSAHPPSPVRMMANSSRGAEAVVGTSESGRSGGKQGASLR